jgi:hypothetical protein
MLISRCSRLSNLKHFCGSIPLVALGFGWDDCRNRADPRQHHLEGGPEFLDRERGKVAFAATNRVLTLSRHGLARHSYLLVALCKCWVYFTA